MSRVLVIAAFALIATGCAIRMPGTTRAPEATPPPPPPPPSIVRRVIETPPEQPPPPAPQPQPPTVITEALVDKATNLADAGSAGEAAAMIEQAIRIEPRRGELWLQLATLRLREGEAAMAEQNARKALLFIRPGSADERNAWLLIADARAAQDDFETAEGLREVWKAVDP